MPKLPPLMAKYQLSQQARTDLRDIWLYGSAQWGAQRADLYVLKIHELCEFLVENPAIGRQRENIHRDLQSYLVGSHVIFYKVQTGGVLIVRFLHQSMDFERHLKN